MKKRVERATKKIDKEHGNAVSKAPSLSATKLSGRGTVTMRSNGTDPRDDTLGSTCQSSGSADERPRGNPREGGR